MTLQFFELPQNAMVKVSGEDALPYLQSQMSIDFQKLSIGSTRLGLRLSLKGRVLFGAQVIRTDEEEFLLACQETPAEQIIELLEENVVADEVEFEQLPGAWKAMVLYSSTGIEETFDFVGMASIPSGTAKEYEDGWAYLDPLLPAGSLSINIAEETSPKWSEKPPTSPVSTLELSRIQAGLFRPGLEIGAEEFPQEGGLERIAVDFDKGCYLGQEVMARIHAMGNVRKQAVAVQGTGPFQKTMPRNLMLEEKRVGMLKSQFSMPDKDEWFGTAILHENALPSLDKDNIVFETNGQPIKPLKI
jgi:folate-binding protein YgfZ